MKKLLKWIITIVIVVMLVKAFNNFVNPETEDIVYLANKTKAEIESTLGGTLSQNDAMSARIYAYTEGELTVDWNSDAGFGIIYIDDKQAGIHTDNRVYSMYNIKIGDAVIGVQDDLTFNYDEHFEVLDDLYGGSSTATFYYNSARGDCLVVIANDTTNRVVALTYYTDGKKATEQLKPLY